MGSVTKATSADEQILAVGNRLIEKYADIPIITIVRVLSEARRTTMDWLQRFDANAVFDLAEWHLRELTLLRRHGVDG